MVGCGSEEKRRIKEAVQFGDMGNQVNKDWRKPRVCFFAYLCLGKMVRIKRVSLIFLSQILIVSSMLAAVR